MQQEQPTLNYDQGQAPLERNPFQSHLETERTLITPDHFSTRITRKVKKFKKVPIYETDESGNKIRVVNEDGTTALNSRGEVMYVIKDFDEVFDGYTFFDDRLPSTEFITNDWPSSNIDKELFLTCLDLAISGENLANIQAETDLKLDQTLNTTANYINFILILAKSLNGHNAKLVKTMISKDYTNAIQEPVKPGPLDGVMRLFTGQPKPNQAGGMQ